MWPHFKGRSGGHISMPRLNTSAKCLMIEQSFVDSVLFELGAHISVDFIEVATCFQTTKICIHKVKSV